MNTGLIGDKRAMKAGAEMFGYSTELVARKRADPRDDIATSLLHV
jgi:cytochrome P450